MLRFGCCYAVFIVSYSTDSSIRRGVSTIVTLPEGHVCTDFGDKVSKCNSTSFAAPVVTALIVQYLADNPKPKVSEVRVALNKGSKGKL